METLKYKIIKSKAQYFEYCNKLEDLLTSEVQSEETNEEIELLSLLINKWDEDNNIFDELDPIQLLRGLMSSNNLKAKDLVNILGVSKGLISDILNYKKGLSKEIIRSLSDHFKISQAALNKPYPITSPVNSSSKKTNVSTNGKELTHSH